MVFGMFNGEEYFLNGATVRVVFRFYVLDVWILEGRLKALHIKVFCYVICIDDIE